MEIICDKCFHKNICGFSYESPTTECIHFADENRLREIVEAEKDGKLVVLPCKVGDTVYLIVHGYVEETKVRTFFIGHPSYNCGEPDPRYEMVRCTNYDFPMKDFGKTIFLTRAEAEEALKGGEENA